MSTVSTRPIKTVIRKLDTTVAPAKVGTLMYKFNQGNKTSCQVNLSPIRYKETGRAVEINPRKINPFQQSRSCLQIRAKITDRIICGQKGMAQGWVNDQEIAPRPGGDFQREAIKDDQIKIV